MTSLFLSDQQQRRRSAGGAATQRERGSAPSQRRNLACGAAAQRERGSTPSPPPSPNSGRGHRLNRCDQSTQCDEGKEDNHNVFMVLQELREWILGHDLSEDNLILLGYDTHYVLKGFELLDQSPPGTSGGEASIYINSFCLK